MSAKKAVNHAGLVNLWAAFAGQSLAGYRSRAARAHKDGVVEKACEDADEMLERLVERFPEEVPR